MSKTKQEFSSRTSNGLQAHKQNTWRVVARPLAALSAALPLFFAVKAVNSNGSDELPILVASLVLLGLPHLVPGPKIACCCHATRSVVVASIGFVPWWPCVPRGSAHMALLHCEPLLEVLLSSLGGAFQVNSGSQTSRMGVPHACHVRDHLCLEHHEMLTCATLCCACSCRCGPKWC